MSKGWDWGRERRSVIQCGDWLARLFWFGLVLTAFDHAKSELIRTICVTVRFSYSPFRFKYICIYRYICIYMGRVSPEDRNLFFPALFYYNFLAYSSICSAYPDLLVIWQYDAKYGCLWQPILVSRLIVVRRMTLCFSTRDICAGRSYVRRQCHRHN